jgi:hypothetical protein
VAGVLGVAQEVEELLVGQVVALWVEVKAVEVDEVVHRRVLESDFLFSFGPKFQTN